ncbi:hypothetical protein MJ590_12920 [Escherichia coli]|nr:hypothetical protein MJ590_12920 [Escherichia coli]
MTDAWGNTQSNFSSTTALIYGVTGDGTTTLGTETGQYHGFKTELTAMLDTDNNVKINVFRWLPYGDNQPRYP